MNPRLKKSLNFIGSIFAVAGIFFIGLRLHHYSTQLDLNKLTIEVCGIIISLSLVYGLANFLLGVTWRCLLSYLDIICSWRWALKVYGISQLAKYVPGNVFHLAGRHSLGLAAGFPGWSLAKSLIWEIGLISFVGGLFGLLVLPLIFPAISVSVSLVLFSMVCFGILACLKCYSHTELIGAFISNCLFLMISGMVFVCLLLQLSTIAVAHSIWIPLCGAYVIAWLAGFLTPGAPAGVGVREFVLLFLLRGVIVEADLLLIIVFGRVVTVIGDVLFFLFVLLIRADGIE